MIDKNKIAILTTVANFELYSHTSRYFPKDIKKYVIDGTNGMHGIHSIIYMMYKLKNEAIDWLIMADEDVIFVQPEQIFRLINSMQDENITVAGVRDGGVVAHRDKNPHAINTFFSILNLNEVRQLWDKKEVLKNQYIQTNEFDDDLANLRGVYNSKSLYEPYYCFYFWLRRKGKMIWFLDSKMNKDEITNEVYFNDERLLYHTWYARSYNINEKHTKRINKILETLDKVNLKGTYVEPIYFKDKLFYLRKTIKKYYKYLLIKLGK